MSYANAIRDIAPGSLWRRGDGLVVNVTAAVACHVGFMAPGVMSKTYAVWPERVFRETFSPLYDREKIRSQFTMSIANLGEFRVFWLPDLGRIMVRSVSCQRQFRVPEGALIVGTYSAPCKAEDFFEALEAVILAPTQAKARAAK